MVEFFERPWETLGARREEALGVLRILFGLVWVLNTWFQANTAYIDHLFLRSFDAGVIGQPAWLASYTNSVVHVIRVVGPEAVALATVVIDGLLAFSLLTGFWLGFFVWVGVFYNLFMWSTVGGMGGPYTQGATDPGTAIVYALVFLFIAIVPSWGRWSLARAVQAAGPREHLYPLARVLLGLLWAFDAFWKWHPYFLHNAVSYLVQSQQGQPAWIVAYIGFFIGIVRAVGPFAFGLFAAIVESLIALGLLFKVGFRAVLVAGTIYSFGLWTTAEGWGGPYGPGFTGNRGDILGSVIIYCFAFAYLMVMYAPSSGRTSSTHTFMPRPS